MQIMKTQRDSYEISIDLIVLTLLALSWPKQAIAKYHEGGQNLLTRSIGTSDFFNLLPVMINSGT